MFGAAEQRRPGGRLGLEDIERRAREVPGGERIGHGPFVDDPAAGHVDDDRARSHLGDLGPADQVASRARQRDMDGDHVGPAQEHRHVHQLDAVMGGLLGRDVRVGADDDHLHGAGSIGDRLTDLPETDDAERPAAQLETGELGPRPFATPDAGVGRGRPPRDAVEQRERVFGGRDRVAGRCVDDRDAGTGRRLEVDVVDADAGPTDDDQPAARGDQPGIDLDLAADDQRVVLGQDRRQLLAGAADALVDLVLGGEEVDALPRHRLGDEDPHAPVPATVKLAMPSRASAARWAAATAAPGSTGRPCWSETISSVLSAPRISSSVTDPR